MKHILQRAIIRTDAGIEPVTFRQVIKSFVITHLLIILPSCNNEAVNPACRKRRSGTSQCQSAVVLALPICD